MDYKATDFPFTIMDVASLLRLNIRRRGSGHIYVDCPICGDRRGKMNLNLTKNIWRCNYCGEGGGMLALYAKVYGISNSDAYKEICDALQTGSHAPEYQPQDKAAHTKETPQSERANILVIHHTFSALMASLTLTPTHRQHLRTKRGLTDEQIDQYGFKSTPPPYLCRSITEQLLEQGCTVQGVPGFYVNEAGKWTLKFHQRTSGILIPIRSVDGLLCGLQTRLDKPIRDKDDPPEKSGIKYLTLSSTGKNLGITSKHLFRVYQLDLEGIKTYPFAFRGIEVMRKAGYQQPPAADYRLVYDGGIHCAKDAEPKEVLERIYIRCNDTFPKGYRGHSLSMSDVVELYDEKNRSYFYCDKSGFTPVQFSPELAKPLPDGDYSA